MSSSLIASNLPATTRSTPSCVSTVPSTRSNCDATSSRRWRSPDHHVSHSKVVLWRYEGHSASCPGPLPTDHQACKTSRLTPVSCSRPGSLIPGTKRPFRIRDSRTLPSSSR